MRSQVSVHAAAWGELRGLVARGEALKVRECLELIGAMREDQHAPAAHYVRAHNVRFETGWSKDLSQWHDHAFTLHVWSLRLAMATAWQMSQALDTELPDVFLADYHLKMQLHSPHWGTPAPGDALEEHVIEARRRELMRPAGRQAYEQVMGGVSFHALAERLLEPRAPLCVMSLHAYIKSMGSVQKWVSDLGERGLNMVEDFANRLDRSATRAIRSRNPLRGGSHILGWAAREAQHATSSFMNFGPSLARDFDTSQHAQQQRARKLEQELLEHLLRALEDPAHLTL